MLVIVVENIPSRLRGRLAVWLLEVRSGVYVGAYGARIREMIWEHVLSGIENGNAILIWAASTDVGFDMKSCGANRRAPMDLDGLKLICNRVVEESGEDLWFGL